MSRVNKLLTRLGLRKKSRFERIGEYKLGLAIAGAIAISLFLTAMSLVLYAITGTASLDLSRPGYESAREQIKKSANDAGDTFSATGELHKSDLDVYLKNYKKKQLELKGYDAFDPNVVSDAQLNLDEPQDQSSSPTSN